MKLDDCMQLYFEITQDGIMGYCTSRKYFCKNIFTRKIISDLINKYSKVRNYS